MSTFILVVGISLAVCGQVWIIFLASRHGTAWLISCFIPPIAFVFAIFHLDECKFPIAMQGLGFLIIYNIISSSPFDLVADEIGNIRKETIIVAEATRRFKNEKGKVAVNSMDLLNAGMLNEESAYDPWGSPYRISSYQGVISISSYGKDELKGGDDNISFGYHW